MDELDQRVRQLERDLAVMSERLAGAREALQLQALKYEERLDEVSALTLRVGSMENWRAKAIGVAAVLVPVSGIIGAAAMRALGG